MDAMAGQEPTLEDRAEARREMVERLHAQLAEKVAGLDSGDAWQHWLGLVRGLHSYSFSNLLLIAAQCENATMVAGFNAWKQRGHSVRRGEKAIRILAPVLRKLPVIDDQGRVVVDADGEPVSRRVMVGVRPVSVFDASQVVPPVEVPPRPQLLTGQAPPGLWESLSAVAAVEGYTVVRADCGTANGRIVFDEREIWVRPDVDEVMACKSLSHELGHALTMTPDDVASYSAQRELREVEAESVAFAVLAAHGVDTSRYTFDYVAGWAARGATVTMSAADLILATGQRVIAAADRILAHTQPDGPPVHAAGQPVSPALAIDSTADSWETVPGADSPGARPERLAPARATRLVGVPR
ncbi:MAG: ImmA/IrrE family metallo-endopeptidase [Actinobacteria bacterium]|nr:ImmA/IrrE family metallo-endopeptidase [Actinomycetota bacterium]